MERCPYCGFDSSGNICVRCGRNKNNGTVVEVRGAQGIETIPVDALPVDSRIQDIGQGVVTPGVGKIIGRDDEEMVWQESPSPLLLSGLVIRYSIAFALVLLIVIAAHSWIWLLVWAAMAGLHIGYRFLELRAISYLLSSQRLEVTSGLFQQTTITYELFDMGDAVIVSPLLLRSVGRANLNVALKRGGFVSLRGIQKAKFVRDVIRSAGQIEASRFDKIRLR